MKSQPSLILLLLVICSCGERKQPHLLSDIRAEIGIVQSLQRKEDNEIHIDLTDKEGRAIKSDSISIYVNGSEVPFTIKKELYYTETTYYLKANARPQGNQFLFEIALPGAPKAFLAKVTALDLVDPQNISYPETGDLNKDVVVTWKDLPGIAYLFISRSVNFKKKDEPNITYSEEEAPDTVKVTSNGKYTVARSTFGNTQKQISTLSFTFVAERNGTMSAQAAKGSMIHIYGNIEQRIPFE
ncbi:hypothetical protein [Taibaiella koreensis]|uniref:hypothetical protein n=1 Tax=Taibaiella koreensis TaxID=1268548 RepID=UPI000E59E1EF|nr:hypothetical protein [Taibaiella koreensis]